LLICCERKTLLNGWPADLADKLKQTGLRKFEGKMGITQLPETEPGQ